jgi:hypothetical protein
VIARYAPDVAVGPWWRFATAGAELAQDRAHVLGHLLAPEPLRATVMRRGRDALFLYLRALPRGGSVVLPVQICPVVVRVVRAAGLVPVFADLAESSPTSGPREILAAVRPDTVAVVVAPLYGHLPSGFSMLTEALGRVRLVLDMAQGLLLDVDPALVHRADAVVYSFAMGKGLDTGGALLLTHEPTDGGSRAGVATWLPTLVRSLALRALIVTRQYARVAGRVESHVESEKVFHASSGAHGPERLYILWKGKIERFAQDVVRARARAERLGSRTAVRHGCRDVDLLCGPEPLHLRQLVRLREAAWRAEVLARLRCFGVDAMPAGEPMPNEYGERLRPEAFPNARAFRDSAIRLGFLGRLSESEFDRVAGALDMALAWAER